MFKKLNSPVLKSIYMLILKIIIIIFTFSLIFTFIFGLYRNLDSSMKPACKEGDLIVFYRLDKQYLAQDIVVLKFNGEYQIRRVIATAGDIVDITENGLMINGSVQQELDIYALTKRYENDIDFPITLSEDQIFVLGDSRENVTDSRVYGAVHSKDTLGKVMAIIRRRNI